MVAKLSLLKVVNCLNSIPVWSSVMKVYRWSLIVVKKDVFLIIWNTWYWLLCLGRIHWISGSKVLQMTPTTAQSTPSNNTWSRCWNNTMNLTMNSVWKSPKEDTYLRVEEKSILLYQQLENLNKSTLLKKGTWKESEVYVQEVKYRHHCWTKLKINAKIFSWTTFQMCGFIPTFSKVTKDQSHLGTRCH